MMEIACQLLFTGTDVWPPAATPHRNILRHSWIQSTETSAIFAFCPDNQQLFMCEQFRHSLSTHSALCVDCRLEISRWRQLSFYFHFLSIYSISIFIYLLTSEEPFTILMYHYFWSIWINRMSNSWIGKVKIQLSTHFRLQFYRFSQFHFTPFEKGFSKKLVDTATTSFKMYCEGHYLSF